MRVSRHDYIRNCLSHFISLYTGASGANVPAAPVGDGFEDVEGSECVICL